MSATAILSSPKTSHPEPSTALSRILRPSLNELGKIKIGGLGELKTSQRGSTYRQPQKHDYFTITTLHRDKDGLLIPDADLMASLIEEYGDTDNRIRTLPIYLLSNKIDEIMRCRYVWYEGKSVAGYSDGETLTLNNSPKTRKRLERPIHLPWKPESGDEDTDVVELIASGAFKLNVRFHCMINNPKAQYGGAYYFRTTGKISSEQLYGNLLQIRDATCGLLRGIPMEMVVRQVSVNPNGQPTTVPVVHIQILNGDKEAVRQLGLKYLQLERENAREVQLARREYQQILASLDALDEEEELPQLAAGVATSSDDDSGKDTPVWRNPDWLSHESEKLRSAKTLEELATRWNDYRPEAQVALREIKEEMKAKLAVPAKKEKEGEQRPDFHPTGATQAQSTNPAPGTAHSEGDPAINDAAIWHAILARKGTTYLDSIKILNSLTTTGPGKYEAVSPSKVISWLDVKLEDREILVRMSKTWKDRANNGGSAA